MKTLKKEPRFWWHWQNLKKDYPQKFVYGRAWLHIRRSIRPRFEASAEWCIPTSLFHLKMDVEWGELSFGIACGLFGLWLTFDGLSWLRPKTYEKREIGISCFMHSLHWHLWADPESWSKGTPKWRNGFFDFADFFLGRANYTKVDQEPISSVVHLPEGDYPVKVVFFTQTWKRPRWPFPLIRHGVNVDSETGLPIPGKGENSWDCDDDAFMSIGTSATTVEEAIADVTKRVNERRERYGGKHWLPVRSQ